MRQLQTYKAMPKQQSCGHTVRFLPFFVQTLSAQKPLVKTLRYNPTISQFYGVDPLAEKHLSASGGYPAFNPYNYTLNNPVMLVDPDGRWIPQLDKHGNVSYLMEEGDSAETLQSQFGLTETEAQQLMPADLKPGEAISGTAVKMITGSEVLRLELHNKQTAEHINDQFKFALSYSKIQGKNVFFTSEYFNIDYTKPEMLHISLSNGNIKFNYDLPLYNTNYSQGIFHPKTYPYFILNKGIFEESSQKGNMFGKLEYIKQIRLNIYLTYGKKPERENLKYQGYIPIYYNTPTLDETINFKHFLSK